MNIPDGATKPCPFCGEVIPITATKCRHCKSGLYADSKPAAEAKPRAFTWEGDDLLVRDGTNLARQHCLLCGSTDGVKSFRRGFQWNPEWLTVVGILVLGPVWLIISMAIAKRAKLVLSRCAGCRSRRVWKIAAGCSVGVGGIFIFPLVGSMVFGDWGFAYGFLAWVASLIAILLVALMTGLRCRMIDEEKNVSLRFPNPAITREVLGE